MESFLYGFEEQKEVLEKLYFFIYYVKSKDSRLLKPFNGSSPLSKLYTLIFLVLITGFAPYFDTAQYSTFYPLCFFPRVMSIEGKTCLKATVSQRTMAQSNFYKFSIVCSCTLL